jgi:hypothetical protein
MLHIIGMSHNAQSRKEGAEKTVAAVAEVLVTAKVATAEEEVVVETEERESGACAGRGMGREATE